ncbi:MAG: hypothetical protein BMS9Abin13_231 [Patescibacteria group bacterium]|nr:MAG: hypothetical protein BMS9Abin13_231 [Patescibacteria group bacterium]
MFTIHKTIKTGPPVLPFLKMKEAVLGKRYVLSLVFIGATRSKTLSRRYRKKNSSANILSFPLSKDEGEIFMDLENVRRDAHRFNREYKNFVGFLFIHGLFHLKGYAHGSTMESEEARIRRKFNI